MIINVTSFDLFYSRVDLEQPWPDHTVFCSKWTLTEKTIILLARRQHKKSFSLYCLIEWTTQSWKMDPYIRALMEDGLDEVLAQEDEDAGKLK